jgi:transcriptional regulator with XRE-family HTH domain
MSRTGLPPTETAPDTAERLIGRPLTPAERDEGEAYDALRAALRAAREDAGLAQAELARRLELGQSEVSRAETSVGPGTRLGRIRAYLAACGAHLELRVRTAKGRVIEVEPDPAAHATRAQAERDLIAHVLALDETLEQDQVAPDLARRLRRDFLRRLGQAPLAGPARR